MLLWGPLLHFSALCDLPGTKKIEKKCDFFQFFPHAGTVEGNTWHFEVLLLFLSLRNGADVGRSRLVFIWRKFSLRCIQLFLLNSNSYQLHLHESCHLKNSVLPNIPFQPLSVPETCFRRNFGFDVVSRSCNLLCWISSKYENNKHCHAWVNPYHQIKTVTVETYPLCLCTWNLSRFEESF